MITHPISRLYAKTYRLLIPNILLAQTKTCSVSRQIQVCTGPGWKVPDFRRAERTAPCRFGFIPENWFLFFYSRTGVTGPYVFGIALANYFLSKEIMVLEHEYYSGLSVALVSYVLVTRLGPEFARRLDKHVDEIQAALDKGRRHEISMYENIVQKAKEAQWQAEGQQILMAAKKECIAIQLEIEYRRRLKEVYEEVKGKMDYQLQKCSIERRLQQACLVDWVLKNVYKSITPEFQKQSLDQAIHDLAASGELKTAIPYKEQGLS